MSLCSALNEIDKMLTHCQVTVQDASLTKNKAARKALQANTNAIISGSTKYCSLALLPNARENNIIPQALLSLVLF